MSDIEWGDPPPGATNAPDREWRTRLQPFIERPGTWGKVDTWDHKDQARFVLIYLRNGARMANGEMVKGRGAMGLKPGDWEFRVARIEGTWTYGLWAKWTPHA